jgi:hypothetical protein
MNGLIDQQALEDGEVKMNCIFSRVLHKKEK